MSHGLIRDTLRFHLAPEAQSVDWGSGTELPIRVDHVLAAGRAGLLALRAFDRIARTLPRLDLTLASADRGAGTATFETPEELQALHAAAHRAGAHFSRPGHGRGDVVHRERFAVPGRILLTAGRRDSAAGAFGMLVLSADPLEVAAVLAGSPYYLTWPGITYLDCTGALPIAVDGCDLWLALAARFGQQGAAGAFLECTGSGISGMSMADRLVLAAGAHALQARALMFPTDESARNALRAQGREPEWKAFPPSSPTDGEHVFSLDLGAIVPYFAPLESLADGRPLSEAGDIRIEAVELGLGASLPDLERLADRLVGRRVHDEVTLTVVPGSRQIMEGARMRGVLDRLVEAGARVLEPGTSSAAGASAAGGRRSGLCTGVQPDPAGDPRGGWWTAGIDACAAACITGTLLDPRSIDLPRERADEPESYPVTDAWIIRPENGAVEGESSVDDPATPFPLGVPIDGPLRHSVLITVGDGVSAEIILPWGARIRPLLSDIHRLAAYVFNSVDAGFSERARRHGGGWIIAGDQFGRGGARDPATLALLALGVRGVIAVSFAADYRRQLVHAGILPLRFVVPAERDRIEEGDELEIPGLPDALWEGAPLVVRNLTRGTRFTVRHDLNARQLDTLAEGGLLRRASTAAADAAR